MKNYTIENEQLTLTVLDYGARIHQLTYKDHQGTQEVVNSLQTPEDHREDPTYLNAVVGRFAGRICSEHITVEGKSYQLNTQDGVHLHGGEGFSKRSWNLESITTGEQPSLTLSYLSQHLEDGYPGNLKVSVTYTLIGATLEIALNAETDQTTIVNLTHHAYFKLDDTVKIDHLRFKIPSEKFLETGNDLCPTGNLTSVENHSYDFREEKDLGNQLLDTPFVIDNSKTVEVYSPITKMRIKATTNQNTAVLYTPTSGIGFCIEAQNYANSPNCKQFPSAELKKGESYHNLTSYEFIRE